MLFGSHFEYIHVNSEIFEKRQPTQEDHEIQNCRVMNKEHHVCSKEAQQGADNYSLLSSEIVSLFEN